MDVIIQKLKSVQNYLNEKGIPVPLLSDAGKPSLSLTLVILSFLLCAAGILEIVKDQDLDKSENLFMICATLYFGRKISKTGTNKLEIDNNKSEGDQQGDDTKK